MKFFSFVFRSLGIPMLNLISKRLTLEECQESLLLKSRCRQVLEEFLNSLLNIFSWFRYVDHLESWFKSFLKAFSRRSFSWSWSFLWATFFIVFSFKQERIQNPVSYPKIRPISCGDFLESLNDFVLLRRICDFFWFQVFNDLNRLEKVCTYY